jgi:predicted ATPase/class 3 adenylate cyclase
MADRPSRTVTFLFTDIQGSTRMWESDADAMRAALAVHDDLMRSVVQAHRGTVFKHTGDGVCAVFESAHDAIDAAMAAQRQLELPVRMGIASGEVQERDGDYFGQTLNRVARVMSAGHGGQIVVSDSSAALVGGVDLVDLGEHRLRDLAASERLFQVRGDGLASVFPPLRTLDATPGNLPVQLTSFVGRELEVKEVGELVRAHRLVTLTGAGGVGKTRLSVQVAAELAHEFPDGIWVVELATIGDPAAVPDAVATVMGVTPAPNASVTESIAAALSGKRLLLVLDNCEHVLSAAADLADTILSRATTFQVLATSREGMRLPAEHVWPVPPLDAQAGAHAPAVELFVQRAQAVRPSFSLDDLDEVAAVTTICQDLDGIALAIELAAARMVSMSAQEVRDHLGDRFRLLSGSGRGPQHHQTLRAAVTWSYDLLEDDERYLLDRCSVFAGGFDVAAAVHVSADARMDRFAVLDLLDSLVRKSLITAEPLAGQTRYGLLETIRQFGEEQLNREGATDAVRTLHASHFAARAAAAWERWNGPEQRQALDWVEREFADLRAGFRWAADHDQLALAVSIAAHTTMLTMVLQRFEPVGWSEELLPRARDADLAELPRLCTAASVAALTGRPDAAVGYAQMAEALEGDPRYTPFEAGWSLAWEAIGHRYAGRINRWLEICDVLTRQGGLAHTIGLIFSTAVLPGLGRSEEARAIADDAVGAARAGKNPFWIAFALEAYARAYSDKDPGLAMDTMDEVLDYTREHRLLFFEANALREIAALEAVLGDPEQALELFDTAVASYHQAGNHGSVATTLAQVAVLFSRLDRPEIAATIYGTSTRHGISMIANLPEVVEHLQTVLGADDFERRATTGAAMEFDDAMEFVRGEIAVARRQLTGQP